MKERPTLSLIDTELLYETLREHLYLCALAIFKHQSKAPGAIQLYANKCGRENCEFCPHFRWKIWKDNFGKWSAYNIEEPLRYARRRDFSPQAREAIILAQQILKIRAELVEEITKLRARERGYMRRLQKAFEGHGHALRILTNDDDHTAN